MSLINVVVVYAVSPQSGAGRPLLAPLSISLTLTALHPPSTQPHVHDTTHDMYEQK